MFSEQQMERFARAVGRRLATPPSDATRESHLNAITQASAEAKTAGAPRRYGRGQLALWVASLSGVRRYAPVFAAVVLILAIVVTPTLRNAGPDLPLLSASGVGSPQDASPKDASAERGMDSMASPDVMRYRQNYVFILADGVSVAAATASAWRLSVDGSLQQHANTLTALFGLPAATVSEWDTNVLVAGDQNQASVTLYPSGEWYYGNYGRYPQWSCPDSGMETREGTPVEPSEANSTDKPAPEMAEPMAEPYECTPPAPATNLPTNQAAQQQAVALFAAVGITDVVFEKPYRDEWTVSIWGTQQFSELPEYRNQGVSVTFGQDGEILGAYGTLARPELLGEYPTVSAADALIRLNAQFADDGSSDLARPMPEIDKGDMAVSDTSMPFVTEIETVTVTLVSVTVVPSQIWSADGFTVIAPHYRFVDTEGNEWWVAAVTDRYLVG